MQFPSYWQKDVWYKNHKTIDRKLITCQTDIRNDNTDSDDRALECSQRPRADLWDRGSLSERPWIELNKAKHFLSHTPKA